MAAACGVPLRSAPLRRLALWRDSPATRFGERNQVSIDESFDLVFQAEGTLDGEPDFGPLEEQFEILSQHQSQNIQMINGQVHRSISWTLTLMAKELQIQLASIPGVNEAEVVGGVQRGIERWAKILMPLLLLTMFGTIL